MLRNITKPGDSGGFEGGVGVEAASDGAVDDGLLLLVQQPNQLPLGPNKPINLPIRMIQKPHDGGLFLKRCNRNVNSAKRFRVKSIKSCTNSFRVQHKS